MLKFNYNDKSYRVFFKHEMNNKVKETTCTIVNETEQTISKGMAYCSPLDNFSRSSGRKLALSRALNFLFPQNKEARSLVWDLYFSIVSK